MGRINVLDIDTVNKIAAGEVVERPASAVKELIENAIDAGADKITVEINNGGISYIRVTDNGCGIASADVEKAFLPHSTSKIKSIDDLTGLYTMGFRGEALASISAVSRVDIITKSKDENFGTAMSLEGGKVVSKTETGCPDGTTIIVKNLFYNTPARMNFLKRDSTEGAHIKDVAERMILGNPSVSFKFISSGREILFSSGTGSITEAFACVYKSELSKQMITVDYEKDGIRVHGLCSTPYAARPNRNMQYFFVNKRCVRSKTTVHAAEEAYKTMLMTGRYPILLLNIEIQPGRTDVNVHPSKLEIKFSDDSAVHSAVYWAVKNALFSSKKEKEIETPLEGNVRSTYTGKNILTDRKKESNAESFGEKTFDFFSEDMFSAMKKESVNPDDKDIVVFNSPDAETEQPFPDFMEAERNEEKSGENSAGYEKFKVIGQLFDTYILVEKGDSLLMIDQHAAHERINYEKLIGMNRAPSQVLMFPESLKLSPKEAVILSENEELLNRIGFETEPFGGEDYVIRKIPADISPSQSEGCIIDILNMIAENKDPETAYKKAMFSVACKSSVRANHKLDIKESAALVERVLEDDSIRTCPHGRPIVISLTKKFIEKEFKRIV